MKVVIPGGSGQVGTLLARRFHADGHEVVVLSRQSAGSSAASGNRPWRVVSWDATSLGPWSAELDGADVVVNLAGRNVNCRYTAANRRAILDSRVDSTRVVGAAIQAAARPPHTWLQASTATIYAHRYDAPNDEHGQIGGSELDAPAAWRFSIQVAQAWEHALDAAHTPRTRKLALRAAPVMSADRGGIFDTLLLLVRRYLGGTSGDGRQYVSWIHARDFLRAIDWLLERPALAGVVNLAAPEPLPNAAFMRALREAWGARFGLPASAWLLELGALFMRTETELVLKSRRVVPGLLLAQGFAFDFPSWPAAARDLCRGWRDLKSGPTAAERGAGV